MVTIKSALSNIKKVKKVSASYRLEENIKDSLEVVAKYNGVSSAELLEAILKETDIVKQSETIKKNNGKESLLTQIENS